MAAGWGVDATISAGVATSGTTSQDVRKVWNSLYSPGVISGAVVTTSASGMTYAVSSGVVAIRTATDEVVLAPVPAVSISTPAAPASGSRIDIVWVRQKFPTIDSSSDVVVERGTALPARAVEIGRFQVAAGATNTNAAVKTGNVDYSIPYGSSMGVLHYWQDKQTKNLTTQYMPVRDGHGTFYLPTDRMISVKYTNVLSAVGASGFDNSKYCEYGFLPNIDGGDMLIWTTNGLHQSNQDVFFQAEFPLAAGTHTISIGTARVSGPGTGKQWYGLWNGYGRRGAEFTVTDVGPIK